MVLVLVLHSLWIFNEFYEVKLVVHDLFGNRAENTVTVEILESTITSTHTDTETYTTDETKYANSFFLTSFFILSIICRNRYQKYMIKNNKKI